MIETNIQKYSLMNNMYLKGKENQYITCNMYNSQRYFNQISNSYQNCQFYQKYNNKNYFIKKKKDFFYKKKINKTSCIYKQKFNNLNNSLNNEENYKKNKAQKIDNKRKTSLETTVSSNSFNSSSNDGKGNGENLVKGKEKCLVYADFQSNFMKKEIEDKQKIFQSKSKEGQNKALIQKKEEKGAYEGNPQFENTEILRVNVKISKDKNAIFKLKRFDDVFETIKLFCEINLVDEKLIKPLIIKSLSTLNTIYQIMNCKLDNQQIKIFSNIMDI
jgi:hypothetical protein